MKRFLLNLFAEARYFEAPCEPLNTRDYKTAAAFYHPSHLNTFVRDQALTFVGWCLLLLAEKVYDAFHSWKLRHYNPSEDDE